MDCKITKVPPKASWAKYHTYEFDGITFYRTDDGYYRSAEKVDGERLLHRVVYRQFVGEIPKRFDVHHKDDDKENNQPWNLEAILKNEHLHYHFGLHAPTRKKHRASIKRYLASPEGKAERSRNSKKRWSALPLVDVKCAVCEGPFKTKIPERATCCSRKCSAHRSYLKRRDARLRHVQHGVAA